MGYKTQHNYVQEIWETASKWEYAIYDTRTNRKHTDCDLDDYQYMRVRLPEEVIATGYGTCWDQTMAIFYLAQRYKLRSRVLFVTDTAYNCHTVCFLQDRSDYWYPESAWQTHKGLHGPYKTWFQCYEEYGKATRRINHAHFSYWKDGIDYSKLFNNKHIGMYDFYRYCGLEEEHVATLQDPKEGLYDGLEDIQIDKYNRVTKLIYTTQVVRWNPYNGEPN